MNRLKIHIENAVQRESMASVINFIRGPFSAALDHEHKCIWLEHDEEDHNIAVTYAAQVIGATAGVMAMTFIDFSEDQCDVPDA